MVTKEHKEKFNNDGYIIISDYFDRSQIEQMRQSVTSLVGKDVGLMYFDRDNNLRRLEKFVFRSPLLTEINECILQMLLDLMGEEQIIFKDKVNFKPAGGEGFYAHLDGVFQYACADGNVRNGWYEYTDLFVNVLIALDQFSEQNGPLEIAPMVSGDFNSLLKLTKSDGTPNLRDEVVKNLNFEPILCPLGSVVVFKNTCPHRSASNRSNDGRSGLYLTYNSSNDGDFYDLYFADKARSKNSDKSLTGERARDS